MDTRIEDKPVIRSGDPAEPGEPLPTRQIGHETLPLRSFLSGFSLSPLNRRRWSNFKGNRRGYWMVGADGKVYGFGTAQHFGDAPAYARQNRAVSASYEPGSTFKAITVSGALEERLATPGSVFSVPPQLQVADRTIHDPETHGYESLTVARILAQSSNIGTDEVGLRLGRYKFDRWVRRFGFGRSTGVDIPGEAAGIVPHPAQYSGSSMGNLPIGQGLAVTPMQMAAAYEAIANGGVAYRPHVIANDRPRARRVMDADAAHEVARMLEGVLGPGGTAQEAKIPGYILAGKTGTAQKAVAGGYSSTKYVASFIGFAPARNPRLLVAVMVDEPQGSIYGGVVAAPAFQKIASFALPYLRIPPG